MKVELVMPKLGESITEATILQWHKQPGDHISQGDILVEVSTDKVDSDIVSEYDGTLIEILHHSQSTVPVGSTLAIIETSGDQKSQASEKSSDKRLEASESAPNNPSAAAPNISKAQNPSSSQPTAKAVSYHGQDIFLSPLVLSIAKEHGLSLAELRTIPGTGSEGRIRKSDIQQYLDQRKYPLPSIHEAQVTVAATSSYAPPPIQVKENDRIEEMDRMRQVIADHMVYSKHTAPHVTCYAEVDLTDIVNWRNDIKESFLAEYGQKLTYTPIFLQAISKAIQKYPMINSALRGTNEVVIKGDINIGMATALPTGNLIVPVVKHTDQKDIIQLSSEVNKLAQKARTNTLKPEDIQGGTFTLSNVGTFGSLTGTPIINQPQAAILATGIIKKRAEVILREQQHVIEIRDMMMLALSFDHRIVDGYLGGSFLKCVADELEALDTSQILAS